MGFDYLEGQRARQPQQGEDKPIATYATQRLFAKIGRTPKIFLLVASIVYTGAGIFLIIAVKFKLLIKEQGIAT